MVCGVLWFVVILGVLVFVGGFVVILGLVVVGIVSLCCVLGLGLGGFWFVLLDLVVGVLSFEWFAFGFGLGVGCFGALGLVWFCCQFVVVGVEVLFGFGW